MDPPLYFRRILFAGIAGASGLALLAASFWRDSSWGIPALAYLPPWMVALCGGLCLGAGLVAAVPAQALRRPPPSGRVPLPLPAALVLVATGITFWLTHTGHTHLGDDAAIRLGNRHLSRSEFDAAEACFRRAAEQTPEDDNAHYLLGVSLAAQDRLAEAARALDQAVALRPDRIDYRMTAAEMEARLDRADRAAAHLVSICERDPERVDLWLRLGDVATASGHAAVADSTLALGVAHFARSATEEHARDLALASAGRLEAARGRLEPALGYYQSVLRRNPRSETALIWTANLLVQLGRDDEARAYIDTFLDSYPGHTAAPEMRAWLHPARVESDSVRR